MNDTIHVQDREYPTLTYCGQSVLEGLLTHVTSTVTTSLPPASSYCSECYARFYES